jgi:hypothetical protein
MAIGSKKMDDFTSQASPTSPSDVSQMVNSGIKQEPTSKKSAMADDFDITCRKLSTVIEETQLDLGDCEDQDEKPSILKFKKNTPLKSKKQETKKESAQFNQQIDDVYDECVLLEGYQLYTLRKGNVLKYMSIMELDEDR